VRVYVYVIAIVEFSVVTSVEVDGVLTELQLLPPHVQSGLQPSWPPEVGSNVPVPTIRPGEIVI
jgi:hypothetical protein